MLHLLPKHTPPLDTLLGDIGAKPQQVAKALGVHPKTVARWIEQGDAPLPVRLALFWITRWGWSQLDAELLNQSRMHAGMVDCLKRRIADLEAQIELLGRIGDFGAANDPAPDVRRRAPVLPLTIAEGEPQEVTASASQSQRPRKKTPSQRRAELAAKRVAKRAIGAPKPFDFLRTG